MFDGIPVGTCPMPAHLTCVSFPNGEQVQLHGHCVLSQDTERQRPRVTSFSQSHIDTSLIAFCWEKEKHHKMAQNKTRSTRMHLLILTETFCETADLVQALSKITHGYPDNTPNNGQETEPQENGTTVNKKG